MRPKSQFFYRPCRRRCTKSAIEKHRYSDGIVIGCLFFLVELKKQRRPSWSVLGVNPILWSVSFVDPERNHSITFVAFFNKAFELSSGDAITALGLASSVMGTDAMTNRHYLAPIINNKMVMRDGFDNIKGIGGFAYHFWGYLALDFIDPPSFLKSRSYIYEQMLQKDSEERISDKLGVDLAEQAKAFFFNPELRCPHCQSTH